jgi:hypothetical protein
LIRKRLFKSYGLTSSGTNVRADDELKVVPLPRIWARFLIKNHVKWAAAPTSNACYTMK